jgi:hypothetical protein
VTASQSPGNTTDPPSCSQRNTTYTCLRALHGRANTEPHATPRRAPRAWLPPTSLPPWRRTTASGRCGWASWRPANRQSWRRCCSAPQGAGTSWSCGGWRRRGGGALPLSARCGRLRRCRGSRWLTLRRSWGRGCVQWGGVGGGGGRQEIRAGGMEENATHSLILLVAHRSRQAGTRHCANACAARAGWPPWSRPP